MPERDINSTWRTLGEIMRRVLGRMAHDTARYLPQAIDDIRHTVVEEATYGRAVTGNIRPDTDAGYQQTRYQELYGTAELMSQAPAMELTPTNHVLANDDPGNPEITHDDLYGDAAYQRARFEELYGTDVPTPEDELRHLQEQSQEIER